MYFLVAIYLSVVRTRDGMLLSTTKILIFGPRHLKACLRANADSEGPDQTAHPRSLIRAFTVRLQNHWILENI